MEISIENGNKTNERKIAHDVLVKNMRLRSQVYSYVINDELCFTLMI